MDSCCVAAMVAGEVPDWNGEERPALHVGRLLTTTLGGVEEGSVGRVATSPGDGMEPNSSESGYQ
jgi:hypothetical protein